MNRESQAATYLRWLASPYASGFLEIRRIVFQGGKSKQVFQDYVKLPMSESDIDRTAQMCIQMSDEGFDVYAGVLPRDSMSGRAEAVKQCSTFWLDIDTLDVDVNALRKRFDIIVRSGNGFHCYRRVGLHDVPDAKQRREHKMWKDLLKAWMFSEDNRADVACAEPARVLRVPGTTNHKREPLDVVMLKHPDKVTHMTDANAIHPFGDAWVALLAKAQLNQLPYLDSNQYLGETTAGGQLLVNDISGAVVDCEDHRKLGMRNHSFEVATLLMEWIGRNNDGR
jgi:hypothetical protein